VRAEARHQLKQDRFAHAVAGTAAGTLTWASEHRNRAVWLVAIAAAILLVVGGLAIWHNQRSEAAAGELSHALRTYSAPLRSPDQPVLDPSQPSYTSANERSAAAQKEFEGIAGKYHMTDGGRMARYFVGVTLKDQGKNAEAEKQLREVANSSNKDIAALAHYALASLYAGMQRDPDAIKEYKELIDHPASTVAKSTAQLELGNLYEQKHQTQDAVKIYQDIKKDEPKGPAAEVASQRLAALGQPQPPTPIGAR
jgi:tetratricopeptide (TPR) repeat protein